MKRILLTAVAALALSTMAFAADATKITGWISDSMCGARHAGSGADCAKKCIKEMHAAPVFVDEDKKTVWKIDNPDAIKDFYGGHVLITSTKDPAKKSLHVDSISAAK